MPRKNPLKVNEELLGAYIGRWKIVSCYYQNTTGEIQIVTEIDNVELTLDEQYDITWYYNTSATVDNDLFHTTSYNIDADTASITLHGTNGRSYSFEVQEGEGKSIKLSSENGDEGLCIVLNKIVMPTDNNEFTLLDAFNEGYFSDLIVGSAQGQKFNVHRCILNVSCNGVKYRDWEMLCSQMSSQGVQAVLHYIYSSTLPPNITVGVAKELSQVTNGNQKFSHLNGLALTCIESTALSNRLQELVDSLVHSLEVIRHIITSTKMDDPAKVVYGAKQLTKELAIGACRVVLLCTLYTQNKQEMGASERRQILEYVQGRIIVFVNEGREILQLLITKWESLTEVQKNEISLYIIPHVNDVWEQLNKYATLFHTTLQDTSRAEDHDEAISSHILSSKGVPLKLAIALQFNSSAKDLKRIKKVKHEFKKFVSVGEAKRNQFIELSEEEKVDAIKRLIREIIHDAQGSIQRLESLKKKILIANVLDWSSYKLGVSLSCSYISWGLNKLLSVKESMKPIVQRLAHLVGQGEFNSILIQLGVANVHDLFEDTSLQNVPSLPLLTQGKCVVNSVNYLAKGCGSLLESKELTDMEFVIQEMATPTTSDHAHSTTLEDSSVVIPAHRVILASRSEWFKRALQSGMIEDRDRRVIVKDVDVSLFRVFLDYLYGNQMDFQTMSKEEIIELLIVADRYETSSLHKICEKQLISIVSDDNVFFLLTTADHLNTRQLRAHTLQYIVDNPDVLINFVEQYSALPIELKHEVRQIMSGTQQISQYSTARRNHSPPPLLNDDYITTANIITSVPNDLVVSEEERDYSELLIELRSIVGEEPTDDDLKSLLLAADMNINRALNYFFGQQ